LPIRRAVVAASDARVPAPLELDAVPRELARRRRLRRFFQDGHPVLYLSERGCDSVTVSVE
jgi:hypothetical protein